MFFFFYTTVCKLNLTQLCKVGLNGRTSQSNGQRQPTDRPISGIPKQIHMCVLLAPKRKRQEWRKQKKNLDIGHRKPSPVGVAIRVGIAPAPPVGN